MSGYRFLRWLVGLALASLAVHLPTTMSSAAFTAQTTNPASTVTAASDWMHPSVTLFHPGAVLRGTVDLAAAASDPGGSGIADVRFDRAARGGTTWTPTGTATAAPYTAPFDTRTVPDGPVDLRAVATDRAGYSATSPVVAVTVDNSPVRGVDVQGYDGGIPLRIDAGDVIELTYSHPLRTTSVLSGWDGSARGVVVRIRPAVFRDDVLDVFADSSLATAVPIGSVDLGGSYINPLGGTALDHATMTAVSTTRNRLPVTVIRIVLGNRIQGLRALPVVHSPTLVWTPASGPVDVHGIGMNTAAVTELGPADRDF